MTSGDLKNKVKVIFFITAFVMDYIGMVVLKQNEFEGNLIFDLGSDLEIWLP